MIELQVNGTERRVAAGTVAALLAEEGLDPGRRGVAVALNGRVVRRDDWAGTPLATGDRVEIVRAVSGG